MNVKIIISGFLSGWFFKIDHEEFQSIIGDGYEWAGPYESRWEAEIVAKSEALEMIASVEVIDE